LIDDARNKARISTGLQDVTNLPAVPIKNPNLISSYPEFFPSGVFDRYGRYEDSKVSRFSRDLMEASEPVMHNMVLEENQSVYRLLLQGSLSFYSTIIRVTIDHATMTGVAVIKTVNQEFAYITSALGGNIKVNNLNNPERRIELDSKQCEEFLSVLGENDFWEITPSETYEVTDGGRVVFSVGLDGEEWVIEGKHGDRYHVVNRWSPDSNYRRYDPDNLKVYRIGNWLLGLSWYK
jgi:hypothetical protein